MGLESFSLCCWSIFLDKNGPKLHYFVQSLRGPRGGMIFFKKDPILGVDLETAINNAVFPGLQVSFVFYQQYVFIFGNFEIPEGQ